MQGAINSQLFIDLLTFVFGLAIGSFLNVLALRTLAGLSVFFPPSICPVCQHRLSALDNIPVLSYLMLRGHCRWCHAKISMQYPVVELGTAIVFLLLERHYLASGGSGLAIGASMIMRLAYFLGMAVFACTLIVVTITDFREKIIPHEITYPSMLFGIGFSVFVRHDALGSLAGIGACYILFDFLAFYGLKFYMYVHGISQEPDKQGRGRRLPWTTRSRLLRKRKLWWSLQNWFNRRGGSEPIEVMGGGDAVLAAVMAAYLGWQLLIVALVVGFILGTAMGLAFLLIEMHRSGLLGKCFKYTLGGATVGACLFGCIGFVGLKTFLGDLTGIAVNMISPLVLAGATAGCLLGIICVGSKVSKPYPFGPALAFGGMVAMFCTPGWLVFH